MRAGPLRSLLALAAPPRCAICGAGSEPQRLVCAGCERGLAAARPLLGAGAGLDRSVAAAAYGGTARSLAHALKYGRRLVLAQAAAALIEAACPPTELRGVLVPVPAAELRRRWRGFDPAEEIAFALSGRTGLPLRRCLRRLAGPRQVGRPRRDRLANPPRVQLRESAPRSALLVDDVHTTGATLAVCASALRAGGATRVVALTLARSRGPAKPG